MSAATRTQHIAALRGASRGLSIIGQDATLPVVFLKVSSLESLSWLRRQPFVDYVEPNLALNGEVKLQSGDDPCAFPDPVHPKFWTRTARS